MQHSKNFNTENLSSFLMNKNKEKLIEFIKDRIFERYIYPVENVPKEYKNGFNMMANACLSIEAFMKILNPIKSINQSNVSLTDKGLFINFFRQFELFNQFKNLGAEFYSDVRCGILHNGETNGLWKINRKLDSPMLEDYNINANKFIKCLKDTINIKLNSFLDLSFDSDEWGNLIFSIDRIIKNHHRYYFAYGSNMNKERLKQRIGVNFKTIGRGILEGFELTFNKKSSQFPTNGVANITKNRFKRVEGIIYEFTGNEYDVSNSLLKLDRAEGSNYIRETYKIKIDQNDLNGDFSSLNRLEVFPYVYICKNSIYLDESLKPSSEYLNHLFAGENHLTANYLEHLKTFKF